PILTTLPNGGAPTQFGNNSSAASSLIFNGGTLQYVGNGATTDRLFSLGTGPTNLDSSGSAPLVFANTGPVGFFNAGNRTFTLQGNNTGGNTLAAAIGDSIGVIGANGLPANGITTLQKNGNGSWVVSGNNTFSGGVTINNGVL